MISRRALSGLLVTLVGPSSVAGNALVLGHCRGSCANIDLPALGYDTFCQSFFDIAASGSCGSSQSSRLFASLSLGRWDLSGANQRMASVSQGTGERTH